MQIHVSFLPIINFEPNNFSEKNTIVIAIDVLRATTTMITALEYGVTSILPVTSVEDALDIFENSDQNSVFLGGERNNIKPMKFHFGNSPFEYQNKEVSNKKVIFTTTNGTKLLRTLQNFSKIYLGCYRNVESLVKHICIQSNDNINILVACAGSNDKFSFDDVLCAGAFVDAFQSISSANIQLTDTAKVANMLYSQTKSTIIDFIKTTSHGTSLVESGFEQDVDYCFTKNASNVIAIYELNLVKSL